MITISHRKYYFVAKLLPAKSKIISDKVTNESQNNAWDNIIEINHNP